MMLDIQIASASSHIPSESDIERWVAHILDCNAAADAELSVRIVDEAESQSLNSQYRQKDRPTNVLSFPCELPEGVDVPLLGDIVICAPVVVNEAADQHKNLESHWAHMLIHGTLHLLGYDHIHEEEAEIMESKEIAIMNTLGYPSPYENN